MKSRNTTNKASLQDLVTEIMKKKRSAYVVTLAMLTVLPALYANDQQGGFQERFQVTSTTFSNKGTLPLSMVAGATVGCPLNGGNQSPELSWTHAPFDTQRFVVVMFDETAAFTHWGMYNISAQTHQLPAGAGMAGSSFGPQVLNDFGLAEYDGPCPPPNITPLSHHYIFTVYALDIMLDLPSSTNFPANADTLYQALIQAGRDDHILASASISGFFPSH
jgi:Raf kinase inhibitor-like YbhB/YbcL family protein